MLDNAYGTANPRTPTQDVFGDQRSSSLYPLMQVSAQYGLLSNVLVVTDNNSSGNNSVVDEKFTSQTGTADDGLASITTLRQLTYRSGQGALARFTALFSPGVADSNQGAGLITAENLLTFSYIGTNFGIVHARDGHDELQELTLTGPGGNETVGITIDNTLYNVNLTNTGTVQGDAFEIATSLNVQVPNYSFTSNNDQVIAQGVISDVQGSFGYSSPGSSVGSWNQLIAGKQPDVTFIPQAQWNVDTRIGTDIDTTLDPTKGNVYQIQLGYLGFGPINFFIEDKVTGAFVLVHKIRYSNTFSVPSVTNPTFRVGWLARNVGNTTNITVAGASMAGFNEGRIFRDTPPLSASNNQASIGSGLTNLMSIRNRLSFGGKVNRAEVLPLLVTGATQSTKFAFFKILLNPVFQEPVTFTYINKLGSLVEITKDSVLVTGASELGTITVVAGSPASIMFNEAETISTQIYPGDTLCLAAVVPSGPSSDCQISMTWQEDI